MVLVVLIGWIILELFRLLEFFIWGKMGFELVGVIFLFFMVLIGGIIV